MRDDTDPLKVCPKCGRAYAFIACRVSKDGKHQCLLCAVDEERGISRLENNHDSGKIDSGR